MPRNAMLLVALALVGGVPVATPALGQPALGPDSAVGWGLSARAGVTWFDGSPLPIATAATTIRLSPSLEVGAESTFGVGSIRLTPEGSSTPSDLSTAYGGLFVRWRPAGDVSGVRWGVSLLTGAGRARVRPLRVNASAIPENFFAIEPRVDLLAYQERSLRVSAALGYRVASAVSVLPGVSVSGFRGPTFVLGAQLVRDP